MYSYFILNKINLYNDIKTEVETKFEKLVLHEYYTRYKTNPNPDEKEKYRKKYLDMRLIGKDWRW